MKREDNRILFWIRNTSTMLCVYNEMILKFL